MKICIIGPGIMPIPPTGWGAVEILIWDYKETLEKQGHEVLIVNTKDRGEIVRLTNAFTPDFVHIQYDEFFDMEDRFECKKVGITSHYGYLDQPQRHGGYRPIFEGFLNMRVANIFSLSPSNAREYTKNGFPEDRIFIIPNGVRDDLFSFEEECALPERSIYLAKIDYRKRQHLFHNIASLYFAGNIADHTYNKNNYLGEWDKKTLYKNLTNYANLVLLSDGEAHPLVCLEAMSAGLGLVLSEFACANLDISNKFISIVPEGRVNDKEYVEKVIAENRLVSIGMRREIRDFAIKNFSWERIVKKYINTVEEICNK